MVKKKRISKRKVSKVRKSDKDSQHFSKDEKRLETKN